MGARKLLGELVFNSVEEFEKANLEDLISSFKGHKDVDAEIELTSSFLLNTSNKEAELAISNTLGSLIYLLCFKVRSLRKFRYEDAVSIRFEDKLLFHGIDCIDSEVPFLIVKFYNSIKKQQSNRLLVRVISKLDSKERNRVYDLIMSASRHVPVSDSSLDTSFFKRFTPGLITFALASQFLSFCIWFFISK